MDSETPTQKSKRRWEEKNKAHRKAYKTAYQQENREYFINYATKWRQQNREKYNAYQRLRRATNVNAKLAHNMRTRLAKAVHDYARLPSRLYSIQKLKQHLESKFYSNPRTGEPMTWLNYGKSWHIDHIIPLSSYNLKDPAQVATAVQLSNLQPLWAYENLTKSSKKF